MALFGLGRKDSPLQEDSTVSHQHRKALWLELEKFLTEVPASAPPPPAFMTKLQEETAALVMTALTGPQRLDDESRDYLRLAVIAEDTAGSAFARGQLWERFGDDAQAEAAYAACIAANPTLAAAFTQLGRIKLVHGEVEQAILNFGHAAKLEAANAASWLDLGKALWHAGDRNDALDCFRKAHRINPTVAADPSVPIQALLELGFEQRGTAGPDAVVDRNTAISNEGSQGMECGWSFANANRTSVPFGMVVPSVYGPIVVNRHDINQTGSLIRTGRSPNHGEIGVLCQFLESADNGAVALDIGANYGLYACAFARTLGPVRGTCHAFEAQRIIASMIGGTAVLNGIENLYVHHVAVGNCDCQIPIPGFDYNKELNFGSIEFGDKQREPLSQRRNDRATPEMVAQITIDDMDYQNVHLIKIDVEGMEELVIDGARRTIARDLPVMCIEWIKSDKTRLVALCKSFGLEVFDWGGDLLCIHPSKQSRYGVNIGLQSL